MRTAADRIYNPLPLYHANAGVVSLMGAIVSGNCQIQPDRFSAQRWWREVAETGATIVHYLGVIAPVLLKLPPGEYERKHKVRFGIGAGIEPELHAAFEKRFGFPMVELWGMTEMVRVLGDTHEPRQVGTRAFGRAVPGVEVRVVDDADRDVPGELPGELLVRHSAETPRRGCFSGYLKDEAATEAAWAGGWFHTGDVVWRGADGMLHFVERKKNIIRRSGENIAAAEVEAVLLTHPDVQQVAVMAVQDELRDEEVLACVVLKRPLSARGRRDGAVPALQRAARLLQGAGLGAHRAEPADDGHAEDPEAQHLPRRHRSAQPAGRRRPARAEAPSAQRDPPRLTQDRVASRKCWFESDRATNSLSSLLQATDVPRVFRRWDTRPRSLLARGAVWTRANQSGRLHRQPVGVMSPYPQKRTFPYCGRAGPIWGARTGLAIPKKTVTP